MSISNAKAVSSEIARKVLSVVDKGLTCGVGKPKPGKMCVEAAVCFAMGEEHGDQPICVHDFVRSFKIEMNDGFGWKSNAERAEGLRKIAVMQLGSNKIDGKKFIHQLNLHFNKAKIVLEWKEKNPRKKKAILVLLDEVTTMAEFEPLAEYLGIDLQCAPISYTGSYATFESLVIKKKGVFRKVYIKMAVEAACQALRDCKCKGVRLWDKLPTKIKNKKVCKGW